MHPYVFQTSAFALRWENVAIIVGIVAGIWLAYRRAASKGEAYQEMLLDLSIYLVLAGVAGGRIWDVLFTWDTYAENPWGVLAVWQGGMSIQGALLGGLIAAVLFARKRNVRMWELLDILAPAALLGQGIGRIGCLTSGDAFGRPIVQYPWLPAWLGVSYVPGTPAYRVFGPVPLVPAEGFEMLADFLICALLLRWRPRRDVPGRTVLLYGLLYSMARFGLEMFRGDSLRFGGMRVAQLLSLVVILLCSALLALRYRSHGAGQANVAG